jgi:DNA-directed RNA polymerase specialized sigma24 family protein
MLLTPKQKIVVDMHDRQGKSQKEIAQILRKSPASISRLYARAKRRVEEVLQHCPCQLDCTFVEAVTS